MVLSKRLVRCLQETRHGFGKMLHRSFVSEVKATKQHTAVVDREAVLYVHWPYCAKRCTYCNFNKYISDTVDHHRMARCLEQETRTLIDLGQISKINSIFFGGGTPSLAEPRTISQVVAAVKAHVNFRDDAEVTLEANPTHLTTDRLREFKDAGITRLSLGVQSLNDEDLKVLGRDHSAELALRCLEKAREIFPGHVSIDFIFGRPGQTVDQWEKEIKQILDVCDKHVSLYQLTLEKGTKMYKWVSSGHYNLPDNDTMADMYNLAVEALEKHGFQRYEVSNFAEKGFESKHNQAYWNGEDYIGVGPGAHGRFTPMYTAEKAVPSREERIQTLQPDNWMCEVERFGHATRKIVQQTQIDRLKELIMLALRTRDGLSSKRWSMLCPNANLRTLFGSSERVEALVNEGFLLLDEHGLCATSRGIAVLDGIISSLLVELENGSINVDDKFRLNV